MERADWPCMLDASVDANDTASVDLVTGWKMLCVKKCVCIHSLDWSYSTRCLVVSLLVKHVSEDRFVWLE